jgi:hypothetical protein
MKRLAALIVQMMLGLPPLVYRKRLTGEIWYWWCKITVKTSKRYSDFGEQLLF